MKRAVFIGRWQPCHLGHEWLIRQKLDKGIPCLILVRDIEPDERNPYTTAQTCQLLASAFLEESQDGRIKIMVISDIESVNWGRGVGYETNDHGECPKAHISGTKIREILASNTPERINEFVSSNVAITLRSIHER